MKYRVLLAAAASAAFASTMINSAEARTCESLVNLKLPDTTIVSAVKHSVGTPLASLPGVTTTAPTCSSDIQASTLPAFCRVTADVATAGTTEPIRFEIWLPLYTWNGRFQAYGNHNFAGFLDYGDLGPELVKGYAIASTNTGHVSTSTEWMRNTQQVINYGYYGVHQMAVKSKQIIKAFYSQKASYSYFNGCSTGGKEGLMAAQRYPEDFDGINIGGSANFAQIRNRLQYVWDGQVTHGGGVPLSPTTLGLVNKAALAACDGNDGVVDGVIDDPLACPFEPSSIQCTSGQDPATCLSPEQVTAVEKVYQGPRTKRGKEIYPGYARGTEQGWNSGAAGTGPGVSTADTFFKFMVYNDPNWDYRTFNFDRDVEPVENFYSPLLDAVDPDMKAFKKLGGKILFSHGWGAPTHTATRSLEYYQEVATVMNGGRSPVNFRYRDFDETKEFFRFFLPPGGTGSLAPQTYDSLPLLEKWVEQGIAPTKINAVHKTNGVVDRSRPICAYPKVAVYKGSGDTNKANNFRCTTPPLIVNYFKKFGPRLPN